MRTPEFRTVADELLPCALAAHAHLTAAGYRVKVEVAELSAPFTPTLTATRGATTLHVDVVKSVTVERIVEWASYGKSAGNDTRLAFCAPGDSDIDGKRGGVLREKKVGLFTYESGAIVESVPPVDLALSIELPTLATKKPQVRAVLGHAYEQFNRGEWREGFEDACKAVESEARRYLKRWSRNRITIQGKHGPQQLTGQQIDNMTMGQLAHAYEKILAPTQLDSMIGQALRKLIGDRNRITHHKGKKITETKLRTNVGGHMWLIVNVLSQMVP